ncbi:MAG TPA: hypothetical protein H9830_03430 [Candidatus Agrococcus pullicola]|uniref:Uncharacterized protein n=1 Tax=Candidatus Agrococcus pullicola TaxID=2838429 RepID=A0A9D2C9G0_9MICO|nr:hypothetical protein [Candidatus Agrococcus pullicola]
MWRTPRNAITPWLFLVAGACMIAAGFIRPEETWVRWVMVIAGILFIVNALLQFVLRNRESRDRSSNDRDVR